VSHGVPERLARRPAATPRVRVGGAAVSLHPADAACVGVAGGPEARVRRRRAAVREPQRGARRERLRGGGARARAAVRRRRARWRGRRVLRAALRRRALRRVRRRGGRGDSGSLPLESSPRTCSRKRIHASRGRRARDRSSKHEATRADADRDRSLGRRDVLALSVSRSVVGSELVASGPAYGPAPRRVRIVGVEDVAIPAPRGGAAATAPRGPMRVIRASMPLVGGIAAPDEADELSGAHVSRLVALLRCEPELEGCFRELDAFAADVALARGRARRAEPARTSGRDRARPRAVRRAGRRRAARRRPRGHLAVAGGRDLRHVAPRPRRPPRGRRGTRARR